MKGLLGKPWRLLLAVALLSASWTAGAAKTDAASSDVEQLTVNRTKQDIVDKWLQYRPMETGSSYMAANRIYDIAPRVTAPYSAGKIKQEYIEDGLNATNFVRYLAGLPDDVTADWSLERQQQTAALVNAVNGVLSHNPSKPKEMDDSMYELGKTGTSSSNLFMGSPTFYDNVLGYMSDSDPSNIDRVGHRRWIINPQMQKTMFGMVNSAQKNGYAAPYASMYAFDRNRSSEVSYNYVAWPSAGYFPQEMFHPSDAWSVSLNPERYDRSRIDQIEVELVRERDGHEWLLNQDDQDKSGEYFNVETTGYGIPFAIIFRPAGLTSFVRDDSFTVKISGLYDSSGQSAQLEFKTTFFKMLPQFIADRTIVIRKGETVQLGIRTGAQTSGNTYSTSNSKIASIDSQGRVKGVGIGTAFVGIDDYAGNNQQLAIMVADRDPSLGWEQVSKWALDDYSNAKGNGLVDFSYDHSYQKPITREAFTELAVLMIGTAAGRDLRSDVMANKWKSPFKDAQNNWLITWASYNSLIKGTSASQFSPNDTITREQAATLLLNVYTKSLQLKAESFGSSPQSAAASDAAISRFTDDGSIAVWAKDNVYKAVALSLMQGTGYGQFTPKGKLTYEQTFVILQHVFEAIES